MISDYFTVSGHAPDWSRTDVYGHAHTHYEFALSIKGREDYLQFRKQWKLAYHELSQLIRNSRHAFRQRHRSDDGMQQWRETWPAVKRYCRELDLHEPGLGEEVLGWPLKAHARFLLALLEAVKASRPNR